MQILDQPRTPLIIEAYRMKRAAGVSEIEEVVTRLDENLFTENLYYMKKTKFENEQQFKVELQNYILVLHKSEFIPGSQPKSKQQTSLEARCRGQRLRSSYERYLCYVIILKGIVHNFSRSHGAASQGPLRRESRSHVALRVEVPGGKLKTPKN